MVSWAQVGLEATDVHPIVCYGSYAAKHIKADAASSFQFRERNSRCEI
jgi:hypothetical protein